MDNKVSIPAVTITDSTEGLEFPEVEPLPPPKLRKPKPLPGHAKKKFHEIAMKVMTKLAMGENPFVYNYTLDDLVQGRIPEFHNRTAQQHPVQSDKEKLEPADGTSKKKKSPRVAWGGTNHIHPAKDKLGGAGGGVQRERTNDSIASVKRPIKVGGGNKFASLVRLARFRKMSTVKGLDAAQKDAEEDEEEEEEEVTEIPKQPRFCATLSAEAQYAMLKGYEDVLLTAFNSVYDDRQTALLRVKTPHKSVSCLHLADEYAAENTLKPIPIGGGGHSTQQRQGTVSLPAIPDSGLYRTTSLVGKLNTAGGAGSGVHQQLLPAEQARKVPKEKQIKLTLRFQKAQDILDTVRMSQGSIVTSPRAAKFRMPVANSKRKKDNPMRVYNDWSQAWAKEFKLKYGVSK